MSQRSYLAMRLFSRSGGLAVLLIAAGFANFANAQSTGGRIRGTVTDMSGASVTGATVTLRNEANGAQRETQSGGNGEYVFLEVPVGMYTMEAQQAGFKKYVSKGVTLELNAILSVDIVLQVGGATETVEVTGAPPLVDTTSTQLGAVVGERAVSEVPLAQRDTYQLLQLQPGVQSQLGVDNLYGSDRAGVVSVNGGRGRRQQFHSEWRRRKRPVRELAGDPAVAGQHRGISRVDEHL